ncbi:MAG: hypothetical protein ABGX10_04965 [Paracoccus sp. (in: a-proteobacteria)]|uniref:hypothetical protein n=1 Tax=unclassified Paracoccus (in: a-proteobacteria) TaxID=2688777 RepID=UPI00147E7E9E|nr:hypothetical protein [Paracoccus sp. SM22M-07]
MAKQVRPDASSTFQLIMNAVAKACADVGIPEDDAREIVKKTMTNLFIFQQKTH